MNPEAMADEKGQPRPGLPPVQSVSRVKQEPHMKAEHDHAPKMGHIVQAFNMGGMSLQSMGAKLPIPALFVSDDGRTKRQVVG